MDTLELIITTVKCLAILVAVIQVVPVMIYVERKVAALIQDRPGPNRVGPFGFFQPLADGLKFLVKEDPIPHNVNKVLYTLAPFLTLLPACMVLAALPIADRAELFGREIFIQIADLDVALIYILAISSLGVYGILFGGWASNNKFSLIGALRSSSQLISYELPLGLATVGAVMVYGTFSLREMVLYQEGLLAGFLPNWGIFYQPLGFLVFLIAAFAETNRLPFDLPESEGELVGGFHTEYGSMKFATFFMAEYMNLATQSGMMTVLFFGGWHLPWITDAALLEILGSRNLLCLVQIGTYVVKCTVFMMIFVWVRWTLPRFRFDQLLHLAWASLVPLSLINIVASAILHVLAERSRAVKELAFVLFSLLTVVAAVGVVFCRSAMFSALNLILSFFGLAMLYLLWGAAFISMVQILIYAGAIVVLFVFVVMLLNLERAREQFNNWLLVGVTCIAAWFASLLLLRVLALGKLSQTAGTKSLEIKALSKLLFTEYLWPFEMLTVFLLALIVAIYVIARPVKGEAN